MELLVDSNMESTDSLVEIERRQAKERRRNHVHEKNKCFKCKGVPHITYRNGLVACKTCFKGAVVESHFRSVIRGFVEPKPSQIGRVLVLLSGGPSSTSLALMTGETVNCKTESKRKMFVEAEMLHVDESIFYPENEPLWSENLTRLKQLSEKVGLKLHVESIAERYKLTRDTAKELLSSCDDRGSSKEDIVSFMRESVIADAAKKLGFKHLLVGDNALRVASNTLTTMVKGRGLWFESVAKVVAEFIPGNSDLMVCRPLKEFSSKEIYFYLHSNELTKYTMTRPHLTEFVTPKIASLPGRGNYTLVLDNFLETLQKDFSSTIFTVLKTSDRTKVGESNTDQKCSLCKASIEKGRTEICYGCAILREGFKKPETVFTIVNNVKAD